MKIKQGLKEVEQEFSNDEKMLISVFKIEAFLRKYKILLLGLGVGLVLAMGGKYIYDYKQEDNAQKSTALLEKIWENPKDEALMQELQALNPVLYDFVMLQNARENIEHYEQLKKSKNPFVAQYASYQAASLQKAFEGEFGIYADLATIQKGFLLLQENKKQEAVSVLNDMSVNAEIYEIGLRLKHYGIAR